jgi:predicted RNase H-related nuclease YkuK (DUF458 family)
MEKIVMKNKFKKFGGELVHDLGEYLRGYLKDNIRNGYAMKVYVGCDSETFRRNVQYASIVAMYDTFRKDGVHYIFSKDRAPKVFAKIGSSGNKDSDKEKLKKAKEGIMYNRLWGEVQRVVEIGLYLEGELGGYLKRYTAEELIKMPREDGKPGNLGSHQDKLVDLDIDINPDPGEEGQNKSNMVYDAAVGWLTGLGFRVRAKNRAWAATCAADMNCKRT